MTNNEANKHFNPSGRTRESLAIGSVGALGTTPSPPFAFIIPLRSRDSTNDWRAVSRRCNETIQSLQSQTDSTFRIFLVCNEPPFGLTPAANIEIVKSGFDVPSNRSERLRDIRDRVKLGMVAASSLGNAFVIRIDADDFLHKRFVEFVRDSNPPTGFQIARGYLWNEKTNALYITNRFGMVCGTSHVIRCSKADFPASFSTPDDAWLSCIWKHQSINSHLPHSRKILDLPFRAAIQRIGDSNSSSPKRTDLIYLAARAFRRTLARRPLTQEIASAFSLPIRNVTK